jgi:plastocyanin
MKRLAYLFATLSVAALVMFVPTAGAQSQDEGVTAVPVQNEVSVSIQDFFFDPADAAVDSGTTVMWINEGNEPHTVTADDGSFDSGVLNPGDSFMVTFLGSGTMTYHCEIHPGTMMGSITVGEGSGGGTATSDQYAGGDTSSGY